MNIFISILLVILTAKILSKVAKRVGISSLIAEFGAGLVLGISFFHLIGPKDVELFAHFGVVLLMFLVGYESPHNKYLQKEKGKLSIIAIVGLIVTLFALFFFGMFFFGLSMLESVFFTFAFALTDVAIDARTLVSLGKLKTRIGGELMNIALIDTMVGFFLLLIAISIITASTFVELELTIGKMALFFLVILMSFRYLHNFFVFVKIHNPKVQFLVAFLLMFLLSYYGGMLQLMPVAVIGAYFAGMLIQKNKDETSEQVCASLKSIAYGIFIPIFFAWVGLSVNLNLMPKYLGKALAICGVALGVKLLIVIIVSKFEKFSWKDSLIYGVGMSARGNDNLIILLVAATIPSLTKSSELFVSALIVLIVVSLLFSSFSLKKLVK
ncbi:cation:proton antiporter [Candidatus Woesearchaeota archaeon]|nr:cation:proton antiporter [Candidatus Woesearchaeota archaeon]